MLRQSRLVSLVSGKRFLSTGSVDSPRIKLAQSILKMNAIRKAKNEKELETAIQASYPIDLNDLPPKIQHLKGFLSSTPVTETYVPNPNFWHNKPFHEFVMIESQRAETWPFIVGGVVTFVLLGIILPMYYPEGGEKNSAYIKLLEGHYFDEEFSLKKHGDDHGDGDDHGHGHH